MSDFGIEDAAILERLYDIFDSGPAVSLSLKLKYNRHMSIYFATCQSTSPHCMLSPISSFCFYLGGAVGRDKSMSFQASTRMAGRMGRAGENTLWWM